MSKVVLILVVLTLLSYCEASLRFASLHWRRITGLTVEFTISTGWETGTQEILPLNFGYAGPAPDATNDAKLILNSVDGSGNPYSLYSRTVVHTYPSQGIYAPFISCQAGCRDSNLENSNDGDFLLKIQVDLVNAGSKGGTQFNVPPIVTLNENPLEFYQLEIASSVLGVIPTCRLATPVEAAGHVPPPGLGVSSDCVLSWATTGRVGQFWSAQVLAIVDSQIVTAVDFSIEVVEGLGAVPTCVTSVPSPFRVPICSPTTVQFQGSDIDDASLVFSAFNVPSLGEISPPSGESLPTPATFTFSLSPQLQHIGTHNILGVFTDHQTQQAICNVQLIVEDLTCHELVHVNEICDSLNSDKTLLVQSRGQSVHWTTDCSASFENPSESHTSITLNSTSPACTISAHIQDPCITGTGERVCSVNVDGFCCAVGFDACGVCGGNNSTCADCTGVPNGDAVVDSCGVCNGDESTCCSNYLNVPNTLWDYIIAPEAVSDLIEKLEGTRRILGWLEKNLPEKEDLKYANQEQVGLMAEVNRLFLQDCGLEKFCEEVTVFDSKLQYELLIQEAFGK